MWYHQYQYAEVIDPMYRNLRNKALPIIKFEIGNYDKVILAVELSFGNNSSQWFKKSQICLFKSGKDLIKLGHYKNDIDLFKKVSKNINLI